MICDELANDYAVGENICIGISVTNFEDIYQKVKENNVPHSAPELMRKSTYCFFLTDPDGIRLQIIKEDSAQ